MEWTVNNQKLFDELLEYFQLSKDARHRDTYVVSFWVCGVVKNSKTLMFGDVADIYTLQSLPVHLLLHWYWDHMRGLMATDLGVGKMRAIVT